MKSKTKSLKKAVGIALAAAMVSASANAVVADTAASSEVITVYLNGSPLSFPDAQPQINSNRTYVPIRQTAEYLGLNIDWNSKTETLTFTRDGMTIAHTMRSSIVYVNGEAKTFDTPSINKNNRTLMPVRMLAESIGAEVEWNNATRSVLITTADNADSTSVQALTASETVVKNGKTIQLTAVASSDTSKVLFSDASTNEKIAEVSDYNTNSDGTRTFITEYTTSNTTGESLVKQIKAVSGTDSAYSSAASSVKTIALVVSADSESSSSSSSNKYQSDYMVDCELEDSKVSKGDYAYVTVVTTDDVDKIKISSSVGSDFTTISKYDEDDDERTFTGKLKMTNTGSVELYIYLSVDGEFEKNYETLNVKVTRDDDDDDDLEINDVTAVQDKVYKGQNVHLVVNTSLAATQIVVKDEDDNKVAKESVYSSKEDDELIWDIKFKMDTSSTVKYTVYASDDNGESVEDTIKIKGKTYSKSDVCALAVDQKSNSVKEGDTCTITIITTSAVDYVELYDDDDNLIEKITSHSKSNSNYTFKTTIDVDDINDIYTATAYNTEGEKDSIEFKLVGEAYESVEINSVDVEDTKVTVDDTINVTVYTNTAAEKVWVEDEDGTRISKKLTKPTDEKNNEYIWELDLDPESKGKYTYTVVATDDDEESRDDQAFKITVTK
jgi:hypothetical protein